MIYECKDSASQGFVFQSFSQGKSKNVCVTFTIMKSKSTFKHIGYLLIIPVLAGSSIFYSCGNVITFPCRIFQNMSTLIIIMFYTLIILMIILKFLFTIKKETLLITVPIGVQFSSSYIYGKTTVTFIPWCAIQDIIIIEVISGQQVLFYLSILLNDHYKDDNINGLLVLFQNTKPRLIILEEMYNIIQQILPHHI